MNKQVQNQGTYTYYQSLYGRNVINTQVVPALLQFLCLPKIIVEVFVRRRMGERYFSKIWSVVVALILYWLPQPLVRMFGWHDSWLYHLFLIAYVIMTVVTWVEVWRAPSVFDFKRFSLDPGKCLPFFYRIRIMGKPVTQRMIDTWLEPLFCIGIGFVLVLLSFYMTGTIILFCSLCHFLSNMLFAIRGDHFIMDKIDEIICNQDLTALFIQDRDVSPRGVPFYAQKPTTKELRDNLTQAITGEPDDAAVAS